MRQRGLLLSAFGPGRFKSLIHEPFEFGLVTPGYITVLTYTIISGLQAYQTTGSCCFCRVDDAAAGQLAALFIGARVKCTAVPESSSASAGRRSHFFPSYVIEVLCNDKTWLVEKRRRR